MPRYDYRCNVCAREFEIEHGMEEVACVCPLCGDTNIERTIPSVAIHGMSMGRFSSANDNTFEHYHIPTEMKQMMKKMEETGEFKKDPKFARQIQARFKRVMAKEHTYSRVDYQKTGHPFKKTTGNRTEI